jgi:hypothetical protein
MIVDLTLGLLLVVPVVLLIRGLYRFSNRSRAEVVPYLRGGTLGDLENLLDFRQEESFRLNLSQAQFRKVQINRIRLLREKLACAEHNATILQEWAGYELERAQLTCDDAARADAEAVLEGCTEFRMAAVWIQFQLNIWYLQLTLLAITKVPLISRLRTIDSFDLVECYKRIGRIAASLAGTSGPDFERVLLGTL